MLAKRIIPCLDLDKGKVVKGIKLDDVVDRSDPLEVTRHYVASGADEMTFIDVTGGADRRVVMREVLQQMASELFMPITVAGGIRSIQDVHQMLTAGADKVAINTAAIVNPDLVREASDRFGSAAIVIAVDARRKKGLLNKGGWELMSHAGRKHTGQDAIEWAERMAEAGVGEVLLTSMDRDGTRQGMDLELIQAVRDVVRQPLIAAGGAGKPDDVLAAFEQGGADAVMVASIFQDGQCSVGQVKETLLKHNIPVRA